MNDKKTQPKKLNVNINTLIYAALFGFILFLVFTVVSVLRT